MWKIKSGGGNVLRRGAGRRQGREVGKADRRSEEGKD